MDDGAEELCPIPIGVLTATLTSAACGQLQGVRLQCCSCMLLFTLTDPRANQAPAEINGIDRSKVDLSTSPLTAHTQLSWLTTDTGVNGPKINGLDK